MGNVDSRCITLSHHWRQLNRLHAVSSTAKKMLYNTFLTYAIVLYSKTFKHKHTLSCKIGGYLESCKKNKDIGHWKSLILYNLYRNRKLFWYFFKLLNLSFCKLNQSLKYENMRGTNWCYVCVLVYCFIMKDELWNSYVMIQYHNTAILENESVVLLVTHWYFGPLLN